MEPEYHAYVGDIGHKIILDVGVDITGATEMQIKYRKPGGEMGHWDAIEEGIEQISYLTKADDFDYAGTWSLQAYVKTQGWKIHGDIKKYRIGASIKEKQ